MALFLLQYSYTSRAIQSLVDRPDEDRAAEASAMVASLGGKLLGYWFAFGDFDGVALIEAPDNSAAAAVAMVVGGAGTVSRLQTTVLLTMEEAREAKRRAATATHVPPGDNGRIR
jgi:uncharacterized protein with GYD domain